MTPKFYEILQKEFRKMTITLSMYNMTTFYMDQNLVLYRKFNYYLVILSFIHTSLLMI